MNFAKARNNISQTTYKQWIRFSIVFLCYLLLVIWYQELWPIVGFPIIFDLYITKLVRWAFWKPKPLTKEERNKPRTLKRICLEWVDAIIYAVVAASLIRALFIEPYTIPTGSMEKTMLVGDFLFVSKLAYGPKKANTPISFPLVHHTLPFTSYTPSFLTWIKRPYERMKGMGKVERNDVVVFNFPEGDTVLAEVQQSLSYYQALLQYDREMIHRRYTVLVRPVDKRENYIKRCVGLPGDTIEIKQKILFVNGEPAFVAPGQKTTYAVHSKPSLLSDKQLKHFDIPNSDIHAYNKEVTYGSQGQSHFVQRRDTVGFLDIAQEDVENIRKIPAVKEVVSESLSANEFDIYCFPHSENFPWNADNYGPLYIPKAGKTIDITTKNLPIYKRIISTYEQNKLEIKGNDIYINDSLSNTYTFKMNYYWMMGDNRQRSLDSRFFGFVPEDHLVGKASFIWFSLDADKSFPSNIRWNRIFSTIK